MSTPTQAPPAAHSHSNKPGAIAGLALGALGVVYGDIGTSPLYAFRECFGPHHGIAPDAANVLGVLSLFFWSLMLVVTLKYLTFIMRADNQGEGGILALLALALPKRGAKRMGFFVYAGLFGAALLYADGALTPAITVLSAVEGLGIATKKVEHLVQPITVAILLTLFVAQKYGTRRVGALFGPIMVVWFATLAATGLIWIVKNPSVLAGLSPVYAFEFLLGHKLKGFWILGSVVLCITGGEALYADMGHFGRKPISLAWYVLVLPALLLNYFGQGALVLLDPSKSVEPFYSLLPTAFLYPLVAISTAASIIASQALISGAFSLTRQAVQLGYLPRMEIRHTSSETEGQIYVPEVNWMLMIACLALVLTVGSGGSTALAAAYGMAVTGTMSITTVLFYLIAVRWWGIARAAPLALFFFVIDLTFFAANTDKLLHGGWIPLAMAAVLLVIMVTWRQGRDRLSQFMRSTSVPVEDFLKEVEERDPSRVKGTAVVMTSSPSGMPPVLLHHYKHNHVLHEQIVLLSIVSEHVPVIPRTERLHLDDLGQGFYRLTAKYGFIQSPRVTDILKQCTKLGLDTKPDNTSFFLGRERLVVSHRHGMPRWQKVLFSFLSRNARPPTDFFHIPPNRVVELGMQVEL